MSFVYLFVCLHYYSTEDEAGATKLGTEADFGPGSWVRV